MNFIAVALLSLILDVHSKRVHHTGSHRSNVTACDRIGADGKRETLAPGPLIRIVTVCRDDLMQLCTLIEFRAHMHIFYPLGMNETGCHTVPLDIRSTDDRNRPLSAVHLNNATTELRHSNEKLNLNNVPDVERVLTTEEECCTIFTRCFTIQLGKTPEDPLYGWHLNLTWERTPESYEFGEVGWSSVGAPIGSLSGVYDLTLVQLEYVLSEQAGFPALSSNLNKQAFLVSSSATERFQARVGDYYECASATSLVLEPGNQTMGIDDNATRSKTASEWPGFRVILVMTDVRSQAFADVNVPEFTGASVVCAGDTSHDGTMSIVIGLSICALVILVLLGLVISHLKNRDNTFKVVDTVDH